MRARSLSKPILTCGSMACFAVTAVLAQPSGLQVLLQKPVTDVPRVTTDIPSSNPFVTLAARAGVPMGVEAVAKARPDPRLRRRGPLPSLSLTPGSFEDLLNQVKGGVPGYDVVVGETIISVAPAGVLRDPNHFLNQTLSHFEIDNATPSEAVRALRRALNPAYAAGPGVVGRRPPPTEGGSPLTRPISLNLANVTPREVLNQLITVDPGIVWFVHYESATVGDTPDAVEQNCLITLVPFTHQGPAVTFPPIHKR
jgi:hypothetical protein